jgi:spermidine/putrescine-binding protein
MGRSVSYASGSVAKAYKHVDFEDDACGDMAWQDMLDSIKEEARKRWPSFTPCNVWLDREDKAILENDLAYIGVSEYCGLLCVWLVPKQFNQGYDNEAGKENLAQAWCERIKPNFEKAFGELRKIATFSNGEAMFEQITR